MIIIIKKNCCSPTFVWKSETTERGGGNFFFFFFFHSWIMFLFPILLVGQLHRSLSAFGSDPVKDGIAVSEMWWREKKRDFTLYLSSHH